MAVPARPRQRVPRRPRWTIVALNTDLIRHSLLDQIDGVDDPDASPATRTVQALAELSAHDQELIRPHTVGGLDLDELAWIVGVDPAAVNEQLTSLVDCAMQLVRPGADGDASRQAGTLDRYFGKHK